MKIVNDSLMYVVIGDWNHYYLDTNKIVSNVFKKNTVNLELGWSPDGNASLLLSDDFCSLQPSTDKFVLTAKTLEPQALTRFDELRGNLITYAKSPMIKAYGFNVRLVGEDSLSLSNAIDDFQESSKLTDVGAIIEFSQFNQKVVFNEFTFNIAYSFSKKGALEISVNQHTECNYNSDLIELPAEAGKEFLARIEELFTKIGYSFEE